MLKESTLEKVGVKLQVVTGDAIIPGEIVDASGFGNVLFILQTGIVSAGTVVISSIQESNSPTMADATDVLTLSGTLDTLSTSIGVTSIGIVPTKRYLLVNVTAAGGANLLVGGLFILGDPSRMPV